MIGVQSASRDTLAVLTLHRGSVSWYETRPGREAVRAEIGLASEELSAVMEAAREARRVSGGKKRDIVLALGEPYVRLRLLSLPALSSSELRGVCRRKAAALCGVALDDVAYVARAYRSNDTQASSESHGAQASAESSHAPFAPTPSDDGRAQRWLLAAAPRQRVETLVAELRRAGLRVKRVIGARLALLAGAIDGAPSSGVRLLLQRDPDGAMLWLCSGGEVLHETALSAAAHVSLAHDDDASLCTALVQEAKSCAAFAQRTLRGESVESFRLDGFESQVAQRLELALAGALRGARCQRLDGADGYATLLASGCAPRHARSTDLDGSQRLRARRYALASVLACAAMLAVVAITRTQALDPRALTDRTRNHAQRARAGAAAAQVRELGERLASLETQVERLAARREATRSFGALVQSLHDAAGSDMAIVAIEGGTGETLLVEGRADPRPLVALSALARVRRRLLADAGMASVEIEPLSQHDDGAAADALSASSRVRLHVRRAP